MKAPLFIYGVPHLLHDDRTPYLHTPNNIRVLFDILHGAGLKVSVVKSGELAL